MRFATTFLALLVTSGCEDRSSFDKRYDETANEIQNRAARIETDLNSTTTESNVAAEPSS